MTPTPEPLGTCEWKHARFAALDHDTPHRIESKCINWQPIAPTPPVPGEPELEMIEVPWTYCWLTLTANRRGTEEANAHYDVEHPCPGPHGTMWAAR
jgi:hypothetical protein